MPKSQLNMRIPETIRERLLRRAEAFKTSLSYEAALVLVTSLGSDEEQLRMAAKVLVRALRRTKALAPVASEDGGSASPEAFSALLAREREESEREGSPSI